MPWINGLLAIIYSLRCGMCYFVANIKNRFILFAVEGVMLAFPSNGFRLCSYINAI